MIVLHDRQKPRIPEYSSNSKAVRRLSKSILYWNWTELGRPSHLTGTFLNIPPSEYKFGLGEVKKKKKSPAIKDLDAFKSYNSES